MGTAIIQDENIWTSICLHNVLTEAGILRFAQFSSLKVQENRERQTTITMLQEEKFGVQFGETAVAKDTDRYRMKMRRYSGRLVRRVKTVGRDPNCVLFVTVEIRTR